jgi:hypothetical protein
VCLQQINSDKELSTLSVLATRRRLKLGELESDNDDVPRNSVDIAPLNSRIDNLQKQVCGCEQMMNIMFGLFH